MTFMVTGACGHMGCAVRNQLKSKYPDCELIPVDICADCEDVYHAPAEYAGTVDCLIDFSHHSATQALTAYAMATKTPLVIATTGQTPEEKTMILQASQVVPVFFASNFSLGIAVLLRLAKQAAAAFPDADIEIVEAHHNRKLDVPSGTALTLAKGIQEVREGSSLLVGRHENGKRSKEEIGIHSLRMGNVVGTHEIHICTPTQTLTLRHEAHDRALFAEGAVAAADFLLKKQAGLYDMESLLSEEQQ